MKWGYWVIARQLRLLLLFPVEKLTIQEWLSSISFLLGSGGTKIGVTFKDRFCLGAVSGSRQPKGLLKVLHKIILCAFKPKCFCFYVRR